MWVYPCSALPLLDSVMSAACNVDDVESSFRKFLEVTRLKVIGAEGQRK
jgi:hypothetical protein